MRATRCCKRTGRGSSVMKDSLGQRFTNIKNSSANTLLHSFGKLMLFSFLRPHSFKYNSGVTFHMYNKFIH